MREFLNKKVNFDTTQDCTFIPMLINETLRFCPSVPMSSPHYPTKDIKIGKYQFKKGDLIIVNAEAIGHNPSEWQRPTEMIPERFDSSNPLSLRPDG